MKKIRQRIHHSLNLATLGPLVITGWKFLLPEVHFHFLLHSHSRSNATTSFSAPSSDFSGLASTRHCSSSLRVPPWLMCELKAKASPAYLCMSSLPFLCPAVYISHHLLAHDWKYWARYYAKLFSFLITLRFFFFSLWHCLNSNNFHIDIYGADFWSHMFWRLLDFLLWYLSVSI